ncbi:hypothetical protein COW38_02860 [Candidatus Collierbacteria bacterium CG17_big_fil_post_rev_8_21_14_2_50_45_7]|uniref:L,D-TPase catalytic domain-containing protein n=1 Tax=Candidatus Collierbacteria bacterium CG17_big_fil_post_rev_8_21_14_2_50_45_7 TaxID=1974536 RepID=A0A2M7FNZ9_9BACT|nr:MAG: hypothetical protein COW38_02860 [Candidatus Collierbacteria bacterium CG17_big_fil_post_rev_8_21_14_2_50_45_7]
MNKVNNKHISLFIVNLLMVTWIFVLTPWIISPNANINFENINGNYEANKQVAIFNNEYIQVPSSLAQEKTNLPVLGQTTIPKRIEVDLTNQRLYAYEGNILVYNFLISSGKWGKTPTGVFRIWIKLRYTKMEGGSKTLGTYYNLPNVPYTMFFYNNNVPKYVGYGIHAAYWHNNFGHPMSHGCIHMKTEEAGLLYDWALPDTKGKYVIHASENNPGTEIFIYGNPPTV